MNTKVMTFIFVAALVAAVSLWTLVAQTATSAATSQASQPTCLDAGTETLPCYMTYYENLTRTFGVQAAFADLKARYAKSAFVVDQCHQLAHAIGHGAAELYPTISEAFANGDMFCWSGYYHGVMEKVVAKISTASLPGMLNSICADIPGKSSYSFEYYNCVHGLGHGVMAIKNDDLFGALTLCSDLSGAWEKESCAGGVFMENVMDETRAGETAVFKATDPQYPCDAVPTEYIGQCYVMQTSHMLLTANGDFGKTFAMCAAAPTLYQAECYEGIGREASGRTISNAAEVRTLCANHAGTNTAGTAAETQCIVGAAKDFVSYFHSDTQAKVLCASLASPSLRSPCLVAVTDYYKSF